MAGTNPIFSLFRGTWRLMDGARRLMHFLLLAGVALLLFAALTPPPVIVPSGAALVLTPRGDLVDQLAGDAISRAFDELSGDGTPQTLTRNLIDAIHAAATDTRIEALVLSLDEMSGAGITSLQDLGRAIEQFRSSGKPVIASGNNYSQAQYYLAAYADEIYLHPFGFVFLEGFGRYGTYYREAIEKLLIDWNVFKVGEYKSFVEPYLRDDMSPESRANARVWLEELWGTYRRDVIAARGLSEGSLTRFTERLPELLKETDGDLARLALETGMVDALWESDRVSDHLRSIPGMQEKDGEVRTIGHRDYLHSMRAGDVALGPAKSVGVIVAAGSIVDGRQPPGMIGGDSTAELVRRARKDENIAAVVLRVNSGGGSAFASEVILRELELLQQAGKPLVVSMGDVAASGGYWIAMGADEIWANPATITGSIGIGAWFPTFQRSLDWVGVHVDGIGTTPWSGDFRPDRALSKEAADMLQLSVEHGYARFVSKVARARELPVEAVESVAQGRVWTGAQAREHGLVDRLGDLGAATVSAAERAGLGADAPVHFLEPEIGFRESLALQFAQVAQRLRGDFENSAVVRPSPLQQWLQGARRELEQLATFNDPQGLYYYCACDY